MQRHRIHARWGFVLPCFVLAGWSVSAIAAPPEEGEGGEDGFEFDAGDDEGSFDDADVVEEVVVAPESGTPPKDGEKEPPPDDDGISPDDGFVFEDISEDEEALAEELQSGQVQAEGEVGTIRGVVHNAKGEPLAGVYVRAKGSDFVGRTGVDGIFELKLPPGTHTLSIELDLYQTRELAGIELSVGEVESADIELIPMAGVQETFEVKDDLNLEAEGALQEARKKKTSVSDGLDAKEISKSGGGKVASVAVRIVGATVVKGRYLYVRGLGHRYGNTLLDGARLPSPEPELRTVPLDVMPSGALSAIDVQKTFTPDTPADFTGGSVQFVTRDVPSELLIGLGVTLGMVSNTTGQAILSNGGFTAADFVAAGNVPRGIPDSFPTGQKVGRGATGPAPNFDPLYTEDQIEAQGQALYTDTKVRRGSYAPPNFGAKLQVGNGWATNRPGGQIGFLLVGGYDSRHRNNLEIHRLNGINDDGLAARKVDLDAWKSTYTVSYNALGKLQWDIDTNHRLTMTGLYAREALDETREMKGLATNIDETRDIVYTRLRYIMRSIAFSQLSGRHRIEQANNLEIEWFGSFSQARRDDPGIREMVFLYNDAQQDWRVDFSKGTVGDQIFLKLNDNTENGALSFMLPFKQWKGLDARFKTGVWLEGKQRQFDTHRYYFQRVSGLEDAIPYGRGNVLVNSTIGGGVSPANGGTEPFTLVEATRKQDNYLAWQRVISGYAQLDLPFVRWFKISGGARLESSIISVEPIDIYAQPGAAPDPDLVAARVVDLDVLPSAALIFSPQLPKGRGDLNVRMTGTRTIGRPEFRELAPFEFRDYVGGFDVQGYAKLVSTHIWNGDLRVEWFPRKSEVLAVSGFFKYFEDPIEQVIGSRIPFKSSFANARAGIVGGVELEARKSLDFLAPKAADEARQTLRDFSVGFNFAYIYSRAFLDSPCYLTGTEPPVDPSTGEPYPGFVERDDCRPEFQATTSLRRPMQGVSPWIVNAYVDYANDDTGTNLRLMYNAFGPRIEGVSGLGLPDLYLQPMHMLDFVGSQRLFAYKRNALGDLRNELSLTFEVSNMLNTIELVSQGRSRNDIFYRTRDGAFINIGLQWRY